MRRTVLHSLLPDTFDLPLSDFNDVGKQFKETHSFNKTQEGSCKTRVP
jgi:hypothetical protein